MQRLEEQPKHKRTPKTTHRLHGSQDDPHAIGKAGWITAQGIEVLQIANLNVDVAVAIDLKSRCVGRSQRKA